MPMLVCTFDTPAGIWVKFRVGSSFCSRFHGAWSVA